MWLRKFIGNKNRMRGEIRRRKEQDCREKGCKDEMQREEEERESE